MPAGFEPGSTATLQLLARFVNQLSYFAAYWFALSTVY